MKKWDKLSVQKMLPEETEYKEKLKNFIISRRWEWMSDLLWWSYDSLQRMFGNSKPQVKFTKQYLVVFHWLLKQKKKELESLIDDIEWYLEF